VQITKNGLMILIVVLVLIPGCSEEQSRQADETGGRRIAEDIVAKVNGVAILRKEYVSALRQAEQDYRPNSGQLTEREKDVLGKRILHKMIQDELLSQHALAEGLSVTREEIEARFEEIKRQGGGDEAFAAFVARRGLDPARIRANLERNLLIERLAAKIKAGQKVDPQEIAGYYKSHLQEFREPGEVDLAHILFRAGGQGNDPETRVGRVRSEIAAGMSFAAAAGKYSDDSATREQGGNLGTLKQGEMIESMEKAAFSVPPGQVSQPVRGPSGVHLLMVQAVRPGRTRSLQEAGQQILTKILDTRVQNKMTELAAGLAEQGRVETP